MIANLIEELKVKAKIRPQRVVFPEADDEKILRAACQARDLNIAYPVLVSKTETVGALAKSIGVSLHDTMLMDLEDQQKIDSYVLAYSKLNPDFPESAVKRMLKDPLYFAAMAVKLNESDCMVAGLSHTTGEVVMASEMIIGLKEGLSTVSSMGIVSVPGYNGSEGNLIAIADCAVCPAPDSNQLADIAISTADTVHTILDWQSRVALLSFSTKGSAGHERVDTVIQALEIVRSRRPDINIDGELQLDSAIVPEVAAKKVKGESSVAGRANILIFPDLNAGNIGVKILQQFAHATAFGPVLQGFDKPVSDLSRGAPLEEIIGAIALVCVLAQK